MATADQVKFKDLMDMYWLNKTTLKRIASVKKLMTANSVSKHLVICIKRLEFKEIVIYIEENVTNELTPITVAYIKSCIEDDRRIRISNGLF